MIDLRSDSVTQPTDRMRDAARDAETGHDDYGEDPTITALESEAADRLGMESAVFVPSGTMANLIAVMTHTEPGQEVILERESHLYTMEVAGLSRVAGTLPRPVDGGRRGLVSPDHVRSEYSGPDATHLFERIPTGLLAMENTHNAKGGIAFSPDTLGAAAAAARDRSVSIHLDGARLFRAAVAHNCSIADFGEVVDSVYLDLAKIGAPAGSVLAGDAEFVEAARHHRQLLGGHMKQVGLLGAPGLVALDETDRLPADAEKAQVLARGLEEAGLDVQPPETNLVFVETDSISRTAADFVDDCLHHGVAGVAFGPTRARFVTHRDVRFDDLDMAVDRIVAAAGT